jgi:probable rRNA maturation factor
MIEINNTTGDEIDLKKLENAVKFFLKKYKIQKHFVSIAFISDEEIKKINQTYRGKNKATDILSFQGSGDFLGEIIISPKQIKNQAEEIGKKWQEELLFVLLHGLLHLIGYEDDSEEKRQEMIKMGNKLINEINKEND